jgi:hypothetical protein
MQDMSYNAEWLPLFPLKTVLFPGGILPLKVFEARYIDMVSDCLKKGLPFGVALIKTSQETDGALLPESIGCLAFISHWETPSPGILMLRMLGGERFRIHETRTLQDQRIEARVSMIAPDDPVAISDIHVDCAKTLKLVIEDLEAKGQAEHGDAFVTPFSRPLNLQSAGWVANRWCEILPIPLKARQKLLELRGAQNRLAIVHQYLQQHQIL